MAVICQGEAGPEGDGGIGQQYRRQREVHSLMDGRGQQRTAMDKHHGKWVGRTTTLCWGKWSLGGTHYAHYLRVIMSGCASRGLDVSLHNNPYSTKRYIITFKHIA